MKSFFLLGMLLAPAVFGLPPLEGGQPDSDHPAVGMIWQTRGELCTGTLITPSVVLTAGHCTGSRDLGFYTGPGAPTNIFSTDPIPGFERHAIDKYAAHPRYVASNTQCPNNTPDLGLLHLAEPVTGITPLSLTTGSPLQSGASCTAVGYGNYSDETGDYIEQRREGVESVLAILTDALKLQFGTAITDHGDSGGPLFCDGTLVAVTSCHTDGIWPQHQIEYDARVDTAEDWIRTQIAAWN
jgi:V8-like Glu-specific endopeptidase